MKIYEIVNLKTTRVIGNTIVLHKLGVEITVDNEVYTVKSLNNNQIFVHKNMEDDFSSSLEALHEHIKNIIIGHEDQLNDSEPSAVLPLFAAERAIGSMLEEI
jgi:hypothetical protein